VSRRETEREEGEVLFTYHSQHNYLIEHLVPQLQ
jgi:hypothetical protein